MMLEGGKIDWAAHAHDAATVVTETIDFDQCIRLAHEFYKKHPDETLILVTADHETGGLGLGNSGTNLNIELQKYQQSSEEALTNAMRKMKSAVAIPSWEEMKFFLKKKSKDIVSLYAKDEPLAVAAVALLDKKDSIGWTTKSHTGAPVPLYVVGKQAHLYSGRRDNTDMANILRRLFNLKQWEE